MGVRDYWEANKEALKTLLISGAFLGAIGLSAFLASYFINKGNKYDTNTINIGNSVVLKQDISARQASKESELVKVVEDFEKDTSQEMPETPYEQLTDANKFLRDFPKEINGAKDIRKYEIRGAKKCLVHVLQSHFVNPGGDFYTDRKNYKEVNKVQKDIYLLLTDLKSKIGLKSVISEGTFEGMKDFDEFRYYDSVKMMMAEKYFPSLNEEDYKYIPGADILLLTEGDFKIIAAKKSSDKNVSSIDIENHILEVSLNQSTPYSVVMLGGRHALGGRESCGAKYPLYLRDESLDNISNWNEKNPENRFSLIEVVPKSFYHKSKPMIFNFN